MTRNVSKAAVDPPNENNETTHVRGENAQQKRNAKFAAKMVDNSLPKIRPYLKLLRMDRPIGAIIIYFIS